MPLACQKEKWWVMVMGVGLDPELSKVVHALRSSELPLSRRSAVCGQIGE